MELNRLWKKVAKYHVRQSGIRQDKAENRVEERQPRGVRERRARVFTKKVFLRGHDTIYISKDRRCQWYVFQ